MKIWKVEINEVEKDPPIIHSNYRANRHTRMVEFYASLEGAQNRSKELYEGAKKLLGFLPGIEAVISEIEVKP